MSVEASPARMTSVLLVDDDAELGQLMQRFFAGREMTVEIVHDGRRGLELALTGAYDIVLLDVMMPGLDGFEVLRQLRRRVATPIILLTARTAKEDRINGLDLGADDYLPKPFDPEELLARMRAVLRRLDRSRAGAASAMRLHNIHLTLGTREATSEGLSLNLTSTEFDVLEHLMRAAGRVVTRNELMTVLHQCEATPYDRSLDVHISHVRKKLGVKGSLIRTVRGAGYMFCTEDGKD